MKNIVKSTVFMSILTFGSRLLGLVRDAAIAMYFGTSSHTDAFFIAFRPFDLVRKLFSEGILSISLVPLLAKTLEKEGQEKAIRMLFSFFCFLSLSGILIIFTGFFFAPVITKLIAPGFEITSYQYGLTILLFKIMLPYVWLILISALCMAVLNTFGNFGLPGVAPVLFNLVVILFTILISKYFRTPVMAIAWGVTAGGVVQLFIQVPFMIRLGMFRSFTRKVFHPELLRLLKVLIPCMVGAASFQVNIMVASFFATGLTHGSVSYIYYADRLVQFPLGLFAVSTATVFLPELSKKAAMGKMDEIGSLFSDGVRIVLFITIPAMAGLMALDLEIVSLLFGRGKFDVNSVQQTADCLFFLVLGLWAFTGTRLFVTLFYSLSLVKVPFVSGAITIIMNFVICVWMPDSAGLKGLAFSVSLSAMAGFIYLFIHIPGAVKIVKKEIIVSACRSLFLSVIMFFCVKKAALLIPSARDHAFWSGTGVLGVIGFGIVLYTGLHHIISSPELKMMKKQILKKGGS